ncbi:hypothetical protein BDF20DRAFT_865986, partial [Mycotypha africana]|uniref:uncharacterized protein n=1 Tax=Mycotypha africana TaxID=64632 RepID=UPI0022FFF516
MSKPTYENVLIKAVGQDNYWFSSSEGNSAGDFYWLCRGNNTNCRFDIFEDNDDVVRIRRHWGGAWLDWNNTHKHLAFYPASGNFKIIWNEDKTSFKLSMGGYKVYNSSQPNGNDCWYVKVGSDYYTDFEIVYKKISRYYLNKRLCCDLVTVYFLTL